MYANHLACWITVSNKSPWITHNFSFFKVLWNAWFLILISPNDGDWVESLTALVEHYDGTLEIIDWVKEKKQIKETENIKKAVSWKYVL